MSFFIMMMIVAISCSIVSMKTLVGYGELKLWYKITVSSIILLGWFAPVWTRYLRKYPFFNSTDYITHNVGYFLFGFVFILFSLLIIRDLAWYMSYGIGKIANLKVIDPKNLDVLFKTNVAVIALSLVASFYALYEGVKLPEFKYIDIQNSKVKKELTIAVITDLHINRGTRAESVKAVVDKVNAQNPDVTVLVGDIIDDVPTLMNKQLEELSKLKAPKGVFAVLGNHEIYRDYLLSSIKFKALGFKFLLNAGESLSEHGVYIAGVPDYGVAKSIQSGDLAIDIEKTFKESRNNEYRVLLSHTPTLFDYVTDNMDIMFSGHTHGGQIFPFHFLVKLQNNYLAGMYEKDGKKLFVSRGAGFWGPPMRLFAPSDVAIVKLRP